MSKKRLSRKERAGIIRKMVARDYAAYGPKFVKRELKIEYGIIVTQHHIEVRASQSGIKHRDPKVTKKIREAVRPLGPKHNSKWICAHLKKVHDIEVGAEYIRHVASDM